VLIIIAIFALIYTFSAPDRHDSLFVPSAQDIPLAFGDSKSEKPRGPISLDYISHFPTGHLPSTFDDPALSTLSDRLIRFLNRPTYTHDETKEYMTEHCPLELADGLVNPDQYKGSIDFWREEVGRNVIIDKRAELVSWLESRLRNGERVVWEEGMGDKRGIVMTGGNKVSLHLSLTGHELMNRIPPTA
jgi:hypothetical protein